MDLALKNYLKVYRNILKLYIDVNRIDIDEVNDWEEFDFNFSREVVEDTFEKCPVEEFSVEPSHYPKLLKDFDKYILDISLK